MFKLLIMKKLVFLFAFIVFASCEKDEEFTPTLTIENIDAVAERVIEVRLVGLEFLNLNIEAGTSKTFSLTDGMLGGMGNVNIDFKIDCNGTQSYYKSMNVNYYTNNDGKNTIIRITDIDPNDTTPMSCGDSNWSIVP